MQCIFSGYEVHSAEAIIYEIKITTMDMPDILSDTKFT
jgi:hypothetical protein